MLGGSAMILLVLALRAAPEKASAAAAVSRATLVRGGGAVTAADRDPDALERLESAARRGSCADRSTGAAIPFPALTQAVETATVQTAKAGAVNPILLIWAVGMALLAAYFILGYAVMVRRLRGTRLAPQPPVDALLDRFRFARDPRICRTANRRAPLTFGVLRPTVLLPEDLETGTAQFQLVLAHELAHIRRKDCLRKTLFAVCLCLYWWHPLVWLMTVLAGRDMELACDEAVLRALGPVCKGAAAGADAARQGAAAACARAASAAPSARSRAEERIRAILHTARPGLGRDLRGGARSRALQRAFPRHRRLLRSDWHSQPCRMLKPCPAVQSFGEAGRPLHRGGDRAARGGGSAEICLAVGECGTPPATDPYGMRVHPLTKTEQFHSGIDLAAEGGENVLAVADGTVLDCSYNEAYGYVLTLGHADGVQTQYAHLRAFLVSPGDTVVQGQAVALVGATGWATGPHLHLGVVVDGEFVEYLARGAQRRTGISGVSEATIACTVRGSQVQALFLIARYERSASRNGR